MEVTDQTVPSEVRISLDLSSRYLQDLQRTLWLLGIRARYERPGVQGIIMPRLYVEHSEHGELSAAICAEPFQLDAWNLEWWFAWRSFMPCDCAECIQHELERIYRVEDMEKAAQIIAGQLGSEGDEGQHSDQT